MRVKRRDFLDKDYGTPVVIRFSAAQKPLASRALRTEPVAAEFYDNNES